MSTDDMQDDEFDTYLNGKSPLSDAYRSLAGEKPSEESDQHLRAAAREAIDKHPETATSPFSSNWGVPVSIAAVLILAVSIVALMPELENETPLPVASSDLQPLHETPTTQPAKPAAKPQTFRSAPQAGKKSATTSAESDMAEAPAEKTRTDALEPEAASSAAIMDETRARRKKTLDLARKQKAEAASKLEEKKKARRSVVNNKLAAPAMSGTALRPAPSDWLNHIQHLRTTGDLKNANIAMDQFIDFYFGKPPYPHQDMLSLLDQANRQRFLAELEALKRTDQKTTLQKLLDKNPYPGN